MSSRQPIRKMPYAVDSGLRGFVSLNSSLVLLGNDHVVMRRDHGAMKGTVKLLSGADVGQDPWPAGFVGRGMLTAAVIVDAAPPPSTVVMRTIRELARDNSAGILIIVQNYWTHRLNFALAAERATNEDINVKIIIVGDDVLQADRLRGRRGLAGVVLILKIAGAMAENGSTIDEIFTLCQSVAAGDVATVGVNLIRATSVDELEEVEVASNYKESVLGGASFGLITTRSSVDIVELNVTSGTFRERQNWHRLYTSPESAVQMMLHHLINPETGPNLLSEAEGLVVLVNNVGNTAKLEECLFTFEAVKQLEEEGCDVKRVYCGSMLTARDVRGFSVTILRLSSPEVLALLDAPTWAPAWPQNLQNNTGQEKQASQLLVTVNTKCDDGGPEEFLHDVREHLLPEKLSSNVLDVLKFAAKSLIACENQLNLFDDFGGDKDCGTKLRRGVEAIESAIDSGQLSARCLPHLFHSISDVAVNVVAGASGALYSAFFDAAAKVFEGNPSVCETKWLAALESGLAAMSRCSKTSPGEGTLIDPLTAAAAEWRKELTDSYGATSDWVSRLAAVVAAAEKSALATAETRTDTDTAIVPDPGAQAVALWLRAAFEIARVLF